MSWSEKYRPKKFEEIVGQDSALMEVKKFIENFNLGFVTNKNKKALLLHGTPGTGKTTLAHVIANETNSEIFELNASDLRNKPNLREILRPAIEQQSLTKKKKIILVDEIDGISSTENYGIGEILSLIEISPYPLIITANDAWSKKLSNLRKKTMMVKLNEVDYRTIKSLLIEILRKEGKFLDNDLLNEISLKSKGDIRAAINDIQREISSDSRVSIDERNRENDIFSVLREIFKVKPNESMLHIFDSLNMDLDEIILWMEKNIPSEYKGEELARAIDLLSKADIFRGRIYKQQYWRFLVYENIFLSYGISASKNPYDISTRFTKYQRPDRILKIWINNRSVEKKKSIAKKYARKTHIGEKRALQEFPIYVKYLKNPRAQEELRLTEEEVEFLRNI